MAQVARNAENANFTGVNPQMLQALSSLLPMLFGSKTNVNSSASSSISPQASGYTDSILSQLIPQITGTQQSDAVVGNILTRAQQNIPGLISGVSQGGYNSTTQRLLLNDLLARATGESASAVLNSQQQAAQTAAQLTGQTQANTATRNQTQTQRTQGQGLNAGSVLTALSLAQRLREQQRRSAGTARGAGAPGNAISASRLALGSLPGSSFADSGMTTLSGAFGPPVGPSGFTSLFSPQAADMLGFGSGVGSFQGSSFADFAPSFADFAPGFSLGADGAFSGMDGLDFASFGGDVGADALSGFGADGVFSGMDALDFASFGGDAVGAYAGDFALDAAGAFGGDFALDAAGYGFDFAGLGADALGTFGGDFALDAAGYGFDAATGLGMDAAAGIGFPYITAIRLGSQLLEGSDIPIVDPLAGVINDAFGEVYGAVGSAVGTYICTALVKLGEIDKKLLIAGADDSEKLSPTVRAGYDYWAKGCAEKMLAGSKWRVWLAKQLMGERMYYIAHKKFPKTIRNSATGYVVDKLGRGYCYLVGRCVSKAGVSA